VIKAQADRTTWGGKSLLRDSSLGFVGLLQVGVALHGWFVEKKAKASCLRVGLSAQIKLQAILVCVAQQ
jgi:hypothetical protein